MEVKPLDKHSLIARLSELEAEELALEELIKAGKATDQERSRYRALGCRIKALQQRISPKVRGVESGISIWKPIK